MLKNKTFTFSISFVFVLSLFVLPIQLGAGVVYLQTRNTIAIVQTGSDIAITSTIEEMKLKTFDHPLVTLKTTTPSKLRAIAENSIYLITIYVGHGTPEGMIVGGSFISWTDLNSWIEEADQSYHIIASCYSNNAITSESRNSYGFAGPIDSHVAGLVIQILLANLFRLADMLQKLITKFFSLPILSLLVNPRSPLTWGPWGPWYTNSVLNGLMTSVIWAFAALGIAYVAKEMIAILGLFGLAAWLLNALGSAVIAFIITEVIGDIFCVICLFWRTRYDPDLQLFQDQYQWRLYNALFQVYYWYSIPLNVVHG